MSTESSISGERNSVSVRDSCRSGERKDSVRLVGLDVLRFAAVLAVVWFHVPSPGAGFTIWHVPSLVIISIALACSPAFDRPIAEITHRRARRLLYPWIVWCGVFLAIDLVRYAAVGRSTILENGFGTLFYGTSLHLWFLPFIFVATVLTGLCTRSEIDAKDRNWRIAHLTLTIVAFAVILLLECCSPTWNSWPNPIPQWCAALPSVFLGIATGLWMRECNPNIATKLGVAIAFLALMLGMGYLRGSIWTLAGSTLFATALFLAASCFAMKNVPPVLSMLLGLAMAIYLIHPIAITTTRVVLRDSWHSSVVHGVLAIAASVAMAVLISKSRLRDLVA
ncbi:acyltransferase family protein [Blastopirellula marina]|uniref:Acyltransferase 3 domain-containing protein n=1 Tax=Blastopirellula marina TaxID=124 RepID=A0A2S8GIN7_9BACT|nr:acyltransferase [Blastopirellula marina]PQO43904.1 hypothetical protein C5Y93_22220 [Blastopirellula marina]